MRKSDSSLRQRYARPSIIGAAFALLLVLSPIAMGGHAFLIIFSLGGLVIVVGGVVTVAFMSFDPGEVRKALNTIIQMFKENDAAPQENLHNDVTAIITCARLLREKGGMRNFESIIGTIGIRDPFLKYGLNMVLSEYAPEEIRAMMETAADAIYDRDSVPVEILQAMTSHAPAFGMVGTLVGMVAMLCNLTDNVSEIGPSLAVAFLSTLYGVLSARILYIPAASKLRQKVDYFRTRNYLITEGMVMLVGKKAPMHIQDRLNGFLRPEAYTYFDSIKTIPPKQAAKVANAA
jgi:chemotaxis protein MotA